MIVFHLLQIKPIQINYSLKVLYLRTNHTLKYAEHNLSYLTHLQKLYKNVFCLSKILPNTSISTVLLLMDDTLFILKPSIELTLEDIFVLSAFKGFGLTM